MRLLSSQASISYNRYTNLARSLSVNIFPIVSRRRLITNMTSTKITKLPIIAFNDVYRVTQKYNAPAGHEARDAEGDDPKVQIKGPKEQQYIGVGQFAQTLYSIRDQWPEREKDVGMGDRGVEREGLVLFAGDVFNPSVESAITRGSHMVPILRELKLDASCVGNHDFDFGYAHLTTLMKSCAFPWLLSNIIDEKTGENPEGVHRFVIKERCGVRIGIVGLVEQDWIATIPSWPETFKYRDMKETALTLSEELRDPKGPHKVNMIIALTHCRLPNDVQLANELGATVGQDNKDVHGVDCLIGGHDHMYYIGKGAKDWEGFRGEPNIRGVTEDKGVCLIKSGTDFRDLSEAVFELEDTPEGSVRTKVVKKLSGKHHEITPETPTAPEIDNLVKSLLSTVSESLSKPVCFTLTPFDVRSEKVRTEETAIGNWVADILMHAYAERLQEVDKLEGASEVGSGEADAVIICGGTFRGDSLYPAGKITLGDILEILPFDDPVVCLELDGKGVHDVLECALSKWPAQEGRFPVVAGLRVVWDHLKPPNERIISIHLSESTLPRDDDGDDEIDNPEEYVNFLETDDGTRIEVKQRRAIKGEEIKKEAGGRTYRIITRNYMAEGYDGFQDMKNRKFIIDDDNGQIMSSIVRSFLLGSAYIFRHKQLRNEHHKHMSSHTDEVLNRHRARFERPQVESPTGSPVVGQMTSAWSSGCISNGGTNRRHVVDHASRDIRDALHLARREHMSEMDALDGKSLRNLTCTNCGSTVPQGQDGPGSPVSPPIKASFLVNDHNREEVRSLDDDIAIVSPLIDGRLKDVSADQH